MLKKIHVVIFTILILVSSTIFSIHAIAQEGYVIPKWVKDNAKWWSENQISDSDFVNGVQYLIEKNIIKIPKIDTPTSSSNYTPDLLKNNAKLWSEDQISDSQFVKGILQIIPIVTSQQNTIQQASTHPLQTIQSKPVSQEDQSEIDNLRTYALELINKDRADNNLLPVQLSNNQAAQAQAEDMLSLRQLSHWMSTGEKPYMTYTRFGGLGNVVQNVAQQGFSVSSIASCKAQQSICDPIVPTDGIKNAEYAMIYNDLTCCNNGHRDNILNPDHTDVSIGIAHDQYSFFVVQNFEDNYISYTTPISENNGIVSFSGNLKSGLLKTIGIFYDPIPTSDTYQEHKSDKSYSMGDQIAAIQQQLPSGSYYLPGNNTFEIASYWMQEGNNVNASFDLSPFVTKSGVYTLVAFLKGSDAEPFPVTSYSITKTSPIVQVGFRSPDVYYACSSIQLDQYNQLQSQFDTLSTQYNATPKTATSDQEYQKDLQMYSQLNTLQTQLQNFRC